MSESEREKRRAKLAAKQKEREKLQKNLPAIRVGSTPWVTSTTTDDRRNKVYKRVVNVGIRMTVRDHRVREKFDNTLAYGNPSVPSPWNFVRTAIDEAFAGAPWPVYAKIVSSGLDSLLFNDRETGWDYGNVYHIEATFRAGKPSKILSEEECVAMLGGADAIAKHLHDAVERGLGKAKLAVKAVERVRIAALVLDDYAERVDQRAQEATRYQQRLAALKAEYDTEVEVQTAKLLAELGDECGVTWEDAPGFVPDPRSTAAAKAKLPERVSRMFAPHKRGGIFPGTTEHQYVTMEDVE